MLTGFWLLLKGIFSSLQDQNSISVSPRMDSSVNWIGVPSHPTEETKSASGLQYTVTSCNTVSLQPYWFNSTINSALKEVLQVSNKNEGLADESDELIYVPGEIFQLNWFIKMLGLVLLEEDKLAKFVTSPSQIVS